MKSDYKKLLTSEFEKKIIEGINKKHWWRTALPKKEEIEKRGLFFTSTYEEAEFYGRPLDTPFKVKINKPYYTCPSLLDKSVLGYKLKDDVEIEKRFRADELIKSKLQIEGYDSVVLVSDFHFEKVLKSGRLPKIIELNLFNDSYTDTE